MQAPVPTQTETQEQYTIRAHHELMQAIPDADDRNVMVWSAWEHFRGKSDAELAADKHFDEERFAKVPNFCYFKEHETLDNQGNPIQFGINDLVDITRTCNRRASEDKAFAAICDNHTSPTDQSHEGDPPVLGAVGAFRLGMIGKDDPKFSIFADEYHYRDTANQLAKKPRRSVELITFHNTGERFIDPVAALGGRAPRLAMPSRYSVEQYSADGSIVKVSRYMADADEAYANRREQAYRDTHVRRPKTPSQPSQYEPKPISAKDSAGAVSITKDQYEMEGPATLPGGSNTYVKSTDWFSKDAPDAPPVDNKSTEFFADDETEPQDDTMQNISDEDIAKLVNAVGNMPEFSWVRQKMDEENGGGAVSPDAPGGMDDVGGMDDGMGDMDMPPEEGPDLDDVAGEEDFDVDQNMMGAASGQPVVTPPDQDADFDDQQNFGAEMANDTDTQFPEEDMNQYSSRGATVSRYSALEAKHNALKTSHIGLMHQLGKVAKQLQKAEYDKVDAQRRHDIHEVCAQYAGIFDPEQECSRLLYSAGAKLSDEEFHNEMARMVDIGHRSHQKDVMRNTVPQAIATTHRGGPAGQIQRNAAWFAKSQEIQTQAADKGKFLDWAELQAETDKAMAGPAS